MIEYLKGEITELTPAAAIVENAGLGYCVNISLSTYAAIQGKGQVKLYIYEAVREDGTTLYGFADKGEREMFLLLMSVSGVGAGTSRMILSSFTVDELRTAILSSDEYAIKSVKGVGAKTAGRIILDLKDKVAASGGSAAPMEAAVERSENTQEAVSALVMLGFAQPAVRKAVAQIVKENPSAAVEDIIKKALKTL